MSHDLVYGQSASGVYTPFQLTASRMLVDAGAVSGATIAGGTVAVGTITIPTISIGTVARPRNAGTVIATQIAVIAGTSIVAAASNPNRISLGVAVNGGTYCYLGFGKVATSTLGFGIPAAANPFLEYDWLGEVQVACASGASSVLAVRETTG